MKKEELARKVARFTIIVGSLTGWKSEYVSFARKYSETFLFYIFMNDYKKQELFQRLEKLVDELDFNTNGVLMEKY